MPAYQPRLEKRWIAVNQPPELVRVGKDGFSLHCSGFGPESSGKAEFFWIRANISLFWDFKKKIDSQADRKEFPSLPHLPHQCHQGSKPCGKFGWFCVEWLPPLLDGVGTSWIRSCKTRSGRCHSIKAGILCLNLTFQYISFFFE